MPTVEQLKKTAASAIAVGDIEAALAAFESLILNAKDDGRLWFNIAMCLRRLGDNAGAQIHLKRAILCIPNYAAGIHEWAQLSQEHDNIGANQAVCCDPLAPSAWSGRGKRELDKGNSTAAKTDFQRAVILQPSSGRYWFYLSLTTTDQTQSILLQSPKARAVGNLQHMSFLKISITTADAPAEAYEHFGAFLQANGQAEEAIKHYRNAITILPGRPDTHGNLASALIEQGETKDALEELDEVLRLDPGSARARWMRAWINLSLADFDRAYSDFDAHWQNPDQSSRQHLLKFPLWTGQPIDNPLLIWGETGVGDEILFASLVKEAAQLAQAPVILECEPRLVSLFDRSLDDVIVIARTTPPDPRLKRLQPAAQCSSVRLPLFLRQRATDFPHHTGYLKPATQYESKVRDQFDKLPAGPLIGISWWSGNPRTGGRKSILLSELRPIFECFPNVQFVSLQYNDDGSDIALLRAAGITNLWPNPAPNLTASLDGLAAQINAVDAVITTVGVNAHMAGALGRPGFVIMQRAPLWYWFRSGCKSPWYPSLKIAREDQIAGFTTAIQTTMKWLQSHFRDG